MPVFVVATLCPVLLLMAGIWWGGAWLWGGFLYMAVLVLVLDALLPRVAGPRPEDAEFPAGDGLLVVIALSHLALLPLAVVALAGPSDRSAVEEVLLFLATGHWMGQVAHPAAHELIHRGNRWLFRLGVAIYTTLLIGHHASAHRLVHHRLVATVEDPNSAPAGMGFWTFLPRAWIGSFDAGWRAETRRRSGADRRGIHPYAAYLGGGAASLALAGGLAGWAGVGTWLGLAALAQVQIFLADYVQHYGLCRPLGADGRPVPVSARHSWNTSHAFSSALMLNAPRHSDHHARPARPYPALDLPADVPTLPWPLPVACAIALFPRLWRRRMKARVARWAC